MNFQESSVMTKAWAWLRHRRAMGGWLALAGIGGVGVVLGIVGEKAGAAAVIAKLPPELPRALPAEVRALALCFLAGGAVAAAGALCGLVRSWLRGSKFH
jgi:hypothetical protein